MYLSQRPKFCCWLRKPRGLEKKNNDMKNTKNGNPSQYLFYISFKYPYANRNDKRGREIFEKK